MDINEIAENGNGRAYHLFGKFIIINYTVYPYTNGKIDLYILLQQISGFNYLKFVLDVHAVRYGNRSMFWPNWRPFLEFNREIIKTQSA